MKKGAVKGSLFCFKGGKTPYRFLMKNIFNKIW